jgi:hypothetical protein
MKNSRSKKILVVMALLILPFYSGVTGNREGNGGDHVRGTYIKMGRAIVGYLTQTKQGSELAAEKGLDLAKLEDTLTIDKIAVAEGELKDNGGSDVDATGVPGLVTLRKEIWVEHFEKERDVYYLVFHEMLRSAGYNDDNYVYSQPLNPFPATLRVATRINPLLPLVDGDSVESMVDTDKITVNGTGCALNTPGTYFDFDSEKNVLEISTDRYKMIEGPGTALTDVRKACALAMPLSVPAGKRLVISQLDLAAKVNLPLYGKATLSLEAFTAGSTGPKIKKVVSADKNAQVGRVQIRLTSFFSTACGGSPILRLNTSGLVSAPSGETSAMKIDRMALYFKVEDCTR